MNLHYHIVLWIGFNPYPDSGGAGEFRGIPNLVPPEDGGYFHPGKTNANSYVWHQGALKATINSYIPNTNWATCWEFFPTYAKMTITGVEATPYWFLYEGTPGGTLDVDSDFVMRSDGTETPANAPWSNDLGSDEWVYFGDPVAGRSLFITNSPGDEYVDSYFPQGSLMTVFGFGRYDFDAYLQNNGQQFVIGLVEDTDFAPVSSAINNASQPLLIEQDMLQFWQTAVSQTNPLTHTITGHTSVTAVFEAELYTIETNVDGQGSITTAPSQEFYLYGDEVVFTATAEDPNSTVPTLTAVDLPQGAEFVDKGDGTAVIDWTHQQQTWGNIKLPLSQTMARYQQNKLSR